MRTLREKGPDVAVGIVSGFVVVVLTPLGTAVYARISGQAFKESLVGLATIPVPLWAIVVAVFVFAFTIARVIRRCRGLESKLEALGQSNRKSLADVLEETLESPVRSVDRLFPVVPKHIEDELKGQWYRFGFRDNTAGRPDFSSFQAICENCKVELTDWRMPRNKYAADTERMRNSKAYCPECDAKYDRLTEKQEDDARRTIQGRAMKGAYQNGNLD